jgi:hypothetical protein
VSLEDALKALDTAVKNAVAGGGEVNQNAWSNISVKKQSTATTAVTGAAADTTIAATAKTDTFSVASGNKWVDELGLLYPFLWSFHLFSMSTLLPI